MEAKIMDVLRRMQPVLDEMQLRELKEVLQTTFTGCRVIQETDLQVVDRSWEVDLEEFLVSKALEGKAVKRDDSHILIEGVEKNTSGFRLLTEKGCVFGKYEEFTTLYKEEENGFILSSDGSVYVEPEPMPEPEPEPEPYEPTLEDLQEAKVAEMNMAQQEIIAAGVDVVLTDGTTEHFTLEDHDQTSLVGLQSQVAAGEENIPWHTSNEAEHCKFYSNKDMKKITATAMAYVTWHVTYFRDLRIYIRSLESKEDVEKVTYGMDIPEAYQSEPLKAMLAQKS